MTESGTETDLDRASDPMLRASLAAMRRAALEARRLAIQTDTDIVVYQDGRIVRISAQELREQMARGPQLAEPKLRPSDGQ